MPTSVLPGPLVSATWLAGVTLKRVGASATVKIVDASWYMPNAKRDTLDEFNKEHIPGAVFLDIDKVADTTHPVAHMLPSPQFFAESIAKDMVDVQGVHHLATCDRNISAHKRCKITHHVFGHDRVAVLDGGLPAWIKAGYPVETGPAEVSKAGQFTPTYRDYLVKTKAQMLDNAISSAPSFKIMDARGPRGRFDGSVPEPRPGLPNGHMPHSVSLPWSEMVSRKDDVPMLKPRPELEKEFSNNGVDLKGPLVASCGSGLSACVLALSAYLTGMPDVAVYDGSWTEWALDPNTPKLQSSSS